MLPGQGTLLYPGAERIVLGRRRRPIGPVPPEGRAHLDLLLCPSSERFTLWTKRDGSWEAHDEPALLQLNAEGSMWNWGADCLAWRERGESVVDLIGLGGPISPDLLSEWLASFFQQRGAPFSWPAALVLEEGLSDWQARLWTEVSRELDWRLLGWLGEFDRLSLLGAQGEGGLLEIDARPRALHWRYWSAGKLGAGRVRRLGWASLLERSASYLRFQHLFEPCRVRLRETLAGALPTEESVELLGRDLRSGLPKRIALPGKDVLASLPELAELWSQFTGDISSTVGQEQLRRAESPWVNGGASGPLRLTSVGLFRPAGWNAFWSPYIEGAKSGR